MSIVLATDTYDTLRPVLTSLRHQIDREQLEIVIVAPDESLGRLTPPNWMGSVLCASYGFCTAVAAACTCRRGSRRIGADRLCRRTHCFPEPDMCNRLLAGFTDEHCAAVVPAIINANPKTALSWASYLDRLWRLGTRTHVRSARAAAQIQRRVSA